MVLDGVVSEWIPIISGMTQGSVLGPLLFILYKSKLCELVENRLFAYEDDTTSRCLQASTLTCCCCLS